MFQKHNIPLNNTFLFSGLFEDYTAGNTKSKDFYDFHFDKFSFEKYLNEVSFSKTNRDVLVKALKQQAGLVENTSVPSMANIDLILNTNTYTVTTGHQLCLFTGPGYFIYKIISTINLAKTLSLHFPDKNFVPVYWMASEDHDFEEINHTHVFGKKISWENDQAGSVGELSTKGIGPVIDELKLILGENENAAYLIDVFKEAYNSHENLADATRYLVNELLGDFGIVILDGDNKELKALFKEEFKADCFENMAYHYTTETIEQLKQPNYNIQVNPREINVFYKEKNSRERIEKQGELYKVVNTDIVFSKEHLERLIETNPEKLSPNVVLRPLYQQKILPNIAYVGGPGEITYWLEYKTMFKAFSIPYPILMPRNFVMIVDKSTQNKLQKLNFSLTDAFKAGEVLIKQHIKTQHTDVHLEKEKEHLSQLFASILNVVSEIDKSLIGSVEAEKQKALNGLQNIDQKINRALKQKSETDINQIWSIKGKLFPNNTPQERWDNFSMYYTKYGKKFISELTNELNYNLEEFEYTILLEK